jgi:type I restriction enzyme S subunit
MTEKELPPGWAWSTLGEVGVYVNGRGFKKSEWSTEGLPIIRIQNLTGSGAAFNYFSGELDDKHLVKHGDLLISWAATLGAHLWKGSNGALNQHIFRVESKIDKRFLYYLINFRLKALQERAHGSGMVHLTRSKFEDETIPVPPLVEQERIVDILENHLSRIDFAEQTLQRALSKFDALQLSLLARAFLADARDRVRLDEVAEIRLGRQRSPKNHFGDSMRPYVRAANVGWDGLLLDDVKEMNFTDREAEVYRLRRGDILMNEASGSPGEVGKPAIWNDEIEGCCFQNTLIRLRPLRIDSAYLYHFLRFEALRGAFRGGSRGVGIHHLGAAKVAEWLIPLPTPEDQARIVEEVDAVRDQVRMLQDRVSSRSGVCLRARRLRERILADAFAGKLVPQDPSDEPASALLERIKVERTAQPNAKRGRASKGASAASDRPAPSTSSDPATFVQEELGL